MSRSAAAIFFAATVLIALAAATVWWRRGQPSQGPKTAAEATEVEDEPAARTAAALLYFPGRGGKLYPEEREVPVGEGVECRIATLIKELLNGPTQGSLYPPLPPEVTLGSVYVTSEAVAYVDLDAPPELARPAWGSKQEILAVYSLVDTVLLNFPEVEAVVLLWNGQQRATFAGHLDTTRPLGPSRKLLAGR